jgi:hypothetical protein
VCICISDGGFLTSKVGFEERERERMSVRCNTQLVILEKALISRKNYYVIRLVIMCQNINQQHCTTFTRVLCHCLTVSDLSFVMSNGVIQT